MAPMETKTKPPVPEPNPTSLEGGTSRTRGGGARGEGVGTRGEGAIVRGPWIGDFSTLMATEKVIVRGWDLFSAGRVHPLPLYPGVFHVGGGIHKEGSTLYTVDVRESPTCSCRYFQELTKVCKHIVAAVAWELDHADGGDRMSSTRARARGTHGS